LAPCRADTTATSAAITLAAAHALGAAAQVDIESKR